MIMNKPGTIATVLLMLFAPTLAQTEPPPLTDQIVDAAIERTTHAVIYDGSYHRLDYPGGDVPDHIGVCTDVVIRVYRAVNIDLQGLVHQDMTAHFNEYPQLWGLRRPDPNIDHRRVPNLQVFLRRQGADVPASDLASDYYPGDLVTWMLPGNLPHIGVVVTSASEDPSTPRIVHNIGNGPEIDDALFRYPITGHYRYAGPTP